MWILDLSKMILKLLNAVLASNTNIIFAATMAGLFVLAVVVVFIKKDGRWYHLAKATPTLLTSIGILGTFVGIVIALMGFDDNNIKLHINEIISGMQTAFISSVIGVFLSILLKIFILSQNNDVNQEIVAYTIELLENQNTQLQNQSAFIGEQTNAMREILKNSQEQHRIFQNQAMAIEKLTNAIGSDSENSLIGQITRLRSDVNDNYKNLIKELIGNHEKQKDFFANLTKSVLKYHAEKSQQFQKELFERLNKVSEIIAKSATEQVINALKEVIKDFNDNLTEQFGENFKELNKAVFKLVQWQENYSNQIEQMIKQYEQGVLAIDNTKQAVMEIEDSTKSIPITMQNLSDVLQVNQHQINELNRHLDAFENLQEKAIQALPKTQEHIDLMIKGIQDGNQYIVKGMNDIYHSMSEKLTNYNNNIQQDLQNSQNTIKDTHNTVISTMKEFNGEFKSSASALTDMTKIQIDAAKNFVDSLKLELDKIARNLEDYVKEINEKQLNQMMKLLNGLDKNAQTALNSTGESIEKQIKALQEAQQQELEQVMTELGRALAAITKQFTNDYSKLVGEMDRVIRMHNINQDRF